MRVRLDPFDLWKFKEASFKPKYRFTRQVCWVYSVVLWRGGHKILTAGGICKREGSRQSSV